MDWFYAEGDQQNGPVTEEEFISLVEAGRIQDGTLIWRDGMPDWKPYGEVKNSPLFTRRAQTPPPPPQAGVAPVPAPEPGVHAGAGQAICVECGNLFPASEVISYQGATVCGNCKPAFFQKVKEGGHTAGNLVYAGFWIRLVAYLLDFIVLFIVSLVVDLTLGLAMLATAPELVQALSSLVQFVIGAAYVTFFLGKYGATPGKMALSIKVVRPDGSPITYGRAFGRYFAEILSVMTIFIGYIIAAFDSEKRALHDHICNTRVIRE